MIPYHYYSCWCLNYSKFGQWKLSIKPIPGAFWHNIFPFFEHFLFKPQNVLGTPCISLSQNWNQSPCLEGLIPLLGNGIRDQSASYVHCFLSVIALVSFKEPSCEIHFVQMSWYLHLQFKSCTTGFFLFPLLICISSQTQVPNNINIIYSFTVFYNTYKIS